MVTVWLLLSLNVFFFNFSPLPFVLLHLHFYSDFSTCDLLFLLFYVLFYMYAFLLLSPASPPPVEVVWMASVRMLQMYI